jgi:hypothetical protein
MDMGKVRVTDLARMIGMAEQDLVFKLRSIGVRVEGEDAQVETDVLKAVLEGKRLATPREVIVRDEDAQRTAAATPRAGAPAPARRLPPEPPRPSRRAIIHKVEAPIPTLPHRERVDTGRPGEDMLPLGPEQGIETPVVQEVEAAAPAAPAPVEAAAVVPTPPPPRPVAPPRPRLRPLARRPRLPLRARPRLDPRGAPAGRRQLHRVRRPVRVRSPRRADLRPCARARRRRDRRPPPGRRPPARPPPRRW